MIRHPGKRLSIFWLTLTIAVTGLAVLGSCGGSREIPEPTPTPLPLPSPTPARAAPAAPVAEATTPAEAWHRTLQAFDEMEAQVGQGQRDQAAASLLQAKRFYVQQFQDRAISLSFDSHLRVVAIFDEAKTALEAGEPGSVRATRLKMDAVLTGIAFLALEEALDGMQVAQVHTWFPLMSRKFGLDENPSPLAILVSESRRNRTLLLDVRDRISAGLLLLMVAQVRAGSQAALDLLASGDERAQGLAEEAVLLYQVTQGKFQEELGDQGEEAVDDGLQRFQEAVVRRDLVEARQAMDQVQTRLALLSEKLELRLQTPTT
jgi:hypothetical protein